MSFQTIRRFFYEIHLWLGIVSGIILFIVCLSGTIYVFREEVQHFAEPEKYYVDATENANSLPIDDLIAKIEKERPGFTVSSITVPEFPNRTVTMSLAQKRSGEERDPRAGNTGERRGDRPRVEGERSGRGGGRGDGEGRRENAGPLRGETGAVATGNGPNAGRRGAPPQGGGGHGGRGRNMIYVNPYTGEVAGEGPNIVDPFFISVMRLHRFLWLPSWIGKIIVGIATIIFVAICLSGIVLWLPRTWSSFKKWRAWKPGFKIRFRKGVWPLMYDLHNSVGFYLLVPLLILALTGLCWSFKWYRDSASYVLGDEVFKGRGQKPASIEPIVDPIKPFSIGEMIERQNTLTPGSGEISVSIPQDNETAMVIQKGGTGFFSLTIKNKTQWDRFRGTVIPVEHFGKTVEVERFADKPLGAKIATSIRGLHFGNITGLSSKIFFFIVCLFATSFPVTGVALWIKKLRTKRKNRRLREASEQQFASVSKISNDHQPAEEKPSNVGQTI